MEKIEKDNVVLAFSLGKPKAACPNKNLEKSLFSSQEWGQRISEAILHSTRSQLVQTPWWAIASLPRCVLWTNISTCRHICRSYS